MTSPEPTKITGSSPVPVDVREAAKGPLLLALHELSVRIAGLRPDEPDLCHCGLVAEVALDAMLAAVDPVIRGQERAAAVDKIAKNLDQIAESYNPVFTPPEYAQEVAVKRLRRAAFQRAAEVARSHGEAQR